MQPPPGLNEMGHRVVVCATGVFNERVGVLLAPGVQEVRARSHSTRGLGPHCLYIFRPFERIQIEITILVLSALGGDVDSGKFRRYSDVRGT